MSDGELSAPQLVKKLSRCPHYGPDLAVAAEYFMEGWRSQVYRASRQAIAATVRSFTPKRSDFPRMRQRLRLSSLLSGRLRRAKARPFQDC